MLPIRDSARKHYNEHDPPISDDDIRHVLRVPFRTIDDHQDDPEQILYIGLDTHSRLLEVVVIVPDDDRLPYVRHADALRKNWYGFLNT